MTLVLGDIGGTNARLAFSNSANDFLKNPKIFSCNDFERIEDLLAHYFMLSNISPTAISLAVAGPVLDDIVKLTNGKWKFSKQKISEDFSLDQANFIVEYSLYYGKDRLIMEFIGRYQSIW